MAQLGILEGDDHKGLTRRIPDKGGRDVDPEKSPRLFSRLEIGVADRFLGGNSRVEILSRIDERLRVEIEDGDRAAQKLLRALVF